MIKISLAKSNGEIEDSNSNSQNIKKTISHGCKNISIEKKDEKCNNINNIINNNNNNIINNLLKKEMSLKNLTPSFAPSIEALRKKRLQKSSN